MSASKKRHVDSKKPEKMEDDGEDETSSEGSSDGEEYSGNEQIQVDFEGRSPEESDFHGIKQMLRQMFLKAPIDLSQMTDVIIKQKSIGSVVKQCDDNPDSDDDEVDQDNVYGITTVIPIVDKEHLQCTKQLKSYLLQKCNAHAPNDVKKKIAGVIENKELQTAFLLNERFVNIPPQIAVPLLKNLSKEVKKAAEKQSIPSLDYYIMLCKLYKMGSENPKKKNKSSGSSNGMCLWSNPEEELIEEMAECSFEFSVKGEADSALGGNWKDCDDDMTPWRRVLLLPAKSLDACIDKIEKNIS